MTTTIKIGKFKIRRDTSVNWTVKNTVLRDGEQGFDTTVKKMKVGDGVTAWLSLPFLNDYLENQIAQKADQDSLASFQESVNTALLDKAEQKDVDDALALKADVLYVNGALDGKADAAAVNNALAAKANQTDVATSLAAKANTSDVNNALALKANSADVSSQIAAKADKTYVDSGLNQKANATDVSTSLAAKLNAANPTYTGTMNGGGANFSGAASAATVNGLQIKDDQSFPTVTQIINKPGQISFAVANNENTSTAVEFGVWDTAALRANGVKMAASPTAAQLQGKVASRILFFFGNTFTASGANYFDTNTLGTDTQKLFTVKNNGTEKFGVLGNGDLTIQGLKVATARQTGWTASTGTANKGAFDTETATLADSNRRIKALEDVLRNMGAIN